MTLRRGPEKAARSAEEQFRQIDAAECGPAKIRRRHLDLLRDEAAKLWYDEFRKYRKIWGPWARLTVKEAKKRNEVWRPIECSRFVTAYWSAAAVVINRYAELLSEAVACRVRLNEKAQTWIRNELTAFSKRIHEDFEQQLLKELLTGYPVIKSRVEGTELHAFLNSKSFESLLKSSKDYLTEYPIPPQEALEKVELAVALRGTKKRGPDLPRIGALPSPEEEPAFTQKRLSQVLGVGTRQIRHYIKQGKLTLTGKSGIIRNDYKVHRLHSQIVTPKASVSAPIGR